MEIVVWVIVYLLITSAFCAYQFYINYKEDGLGWWVYLLIGFIFGWFATPITMIVKLVDFLSYIIATIMGKIIDFIFGRPIV